MVKNLQVNCEKGIKIEKVSIHKLVNQLKNNLSFSVSSLLINFISSNKIFEINKKYLKHNYSTDIITFNYSGSNLDLDGELFISVHDAEKNAKRYNVTFKEEISRLVIHGILHLLNYDDKKESDRLVMKHKEDELLNTYYFV